MNTNKTVEIQGTKYRMYQVALTGFVFVESKKTRRTYPVAKIVDGTIVEIKAEPAINAATNAELAQMWLDN